MKMIGIVVPWVPEGFFFRSETAIVSGEAAIEILARNPRISIAPPPLTIAVSLRKKSSGTQGSIIAERPKKFF